MDLLRTIIGRPQASVTWSPLDSRWYTSDLGQPSSAGVYVNAETIFRCGTVLAAVRFLADSWAMCPPHVGRRLEGGARRMEPGHYAQRVLRNPTVWLTGNRWRHLNMVRVTTWGNAYCRIVGGRAAFVEELRPLDPWRVKVASQQPDGTLVYEYTPPNGQAETIGQESMLHFRGLSMDAVQGAPMYQLIRNAVGIALAAERHVGTFLRKGTRLAGVLVPTHDPLSDDNQKRVKESWDRAFGGSENAGTVGLLPYGLDLKVLSLDHQKAQLLELRDFQVGEILRFIGVPGVVVGWGEKTATYASAKEFFESGGVKHSILPWITNLEAEEERALLFEDDLFIKHNLDVLLRANTKDRYDALFKATGRPWMTGNEARAIEDMNPSDDPSMDKVPPPPNTAGTPEGGPEPEPDGGPPEPARPAPAPPPPPPDDNEEQATLLWNYALSAAVRVVRREMTAMRDPRRIALAKDEPRWRAWVESYYDGHVGHVRAALPSITEDRARAYAAEQRDRLLAGGPAAMVDWETNVAPRLAALALED